MAASPVAKVSIDLMRFPVEIWSCTKATGLKREARRCNFHSQYAKAKVRRGLLLLFGGPAICFPDSR